MDGFWLQGELDLTLFYKTEGYFDNLKFLMTLMTVTFMPGNASKHSFVFLMKLLSCLSRCFCSPIVGFYQQWAFMILHNFDSDKVVPFLFLDALNNQVRIGRFNRWSLVKVLNIGSVGQEENVGTIRYFLHYLHHEG